MARSRWLPAVALLLIAGVPVTAAAQVDTAPPPPPAANAVAPVPHAADSVPIPAGTYVFVPEESDDIGPLVKEAVHHMFFAIRGIAGGRLRNANKPIDRIIIKYPPDSVYMSLRADEPPVVSLRNGEFAPYTREDGEVVQVKTELSPGVIDQFFHSEDGDKQMVYTLRPDGLLQLHVTLFSDKLKGPFEYTWVYRAQSAEAAPPAGAAAEGGGGVAATSGRPDLGRPVHTFSIVARDPDSGELGVAVQSHWFSVGPLVPWAAPGVGAVATQSFIESSYGPLGLDLMRAGRTADQALAALLAADEHPEVRQVAMVDAQGRVAAHTGASDIQHASHITGDGFSVQSNMMLKSTVPAAMAKAYRTTDGDLTERLLAALEAAQAEGGDIRGSQSAAILVVSGDATLMPWQGRVVDLRVEDNPHPVRELRRLVTLSRAYARMNAGDAAMTEGDVARALEEYAAAEAMVPDSASNGEMAFWHAVTLASLGRVEESLPLFRRAFAQDENWKELLRRLPAAGQFPDDSSLVARITSLPPAR